MSKRQVFTTFARLVGPKLAAAGFEGDLGHYVRRADPLVQVVELQHSIYGGRITANLGLDLSWLRPLVRWIPQPEIGPHAHDSTRWIRIGMVRPDRTDQWWPFSEEEQSLVEATEGVGAAVLDHGLGWLEREGRVEPFLEYAQERLARSRSRAQPEGSFLELRLMAAVLAWSGQRDAAQIVIELARPLWTDEKKRLASARDLYRRRHLGGEVRLPGVPDLQRELEQLISPTRGARPPRGDPSSRAPGRRSKSARPRSSRA